MTLHGARTSIDPLEGKAPEVALFRETVRRFLSEDVAPHYAAWEKAGQVPNAFYTRMGQRGLLCVDLPEEYGGAGAPFEFSLVVLEEVARMGFTSLASNLSVHSDIAACYILHLGNEHQKRKYLPRMARGECIGAVAMTEPAAGSDLQGIRTTASRCEAGFLVNGSKTFITNGQNCGVVVTAVKTDPSAGAKGITLLTLDSELAGFVRGRRLEKVGQHAADTSELFFDDVRVPVEEVLGRPNAGFLHLMQELPRERLVLGAMAVAHAQGAFDHTVEYVTTRTAFGQALSTFQNTRFELARMKTEIEVHRSFVEKCIGCYTNGLLSGEMAAMVKVSTTEMEGRVTDACLQLFGGYGYMAEYPISRYWTDARIQRIYGGTSEIMREVIARSIVGRAA